MADSPCLQALALEKNVGPEIIETVRRRIATVVPTLQATCDDAATVLILRHSADMLARIFPTLALDLTQGPLAKSIAQTAQAANPDLTIVYGSAAGPQISVGSPRPDAFFVDSSGWRLRVSSPGQAKQPFSNHDSPNPASTLLASALVVARLLAELPDLFDYRAPARPTEINLWDPSGQGDGPAIPPTLVLDIHLLGHGSISHAAMGALCHWPELKGRVVAVDHDRYESRNLARYIHLTPSSGGAKKVDALKGILQGHRDLDVTPVAATIQEWRKATEDPPRFALISPDNREARAWAADSLPAVAIAASADSREARAYLCSQETGICAYCMHAAPLNDGIHVQQQIVDFTGIALPDVRRLTNEMRGQNGAPKMHDNIVATIEKHMQKPAGSLAHWRGRTLFDFLDVHRAQFYSTALLNIDGGDPVHLPVPVASAATGALALAGLLRYLVEDSNDTAFNCMTLDVYSGGPLIFKRDSRPPSRTCLCQHPARRRWRQ